MKLTFDKFSSFIFFAFFSGFGFIFFNIWQSVDKLNENMAGILVDITYQRNMINSHDTRLNNLEFKYRK